jgi:hypothetical protein
MLAQMRSVINHATLGWSALVFVYPGATHGYFTSKK